MTESCPFGCSWEEADILCKDENAILAEPDFHIAIEEEDDGRDDLNDYEFLKTLADQTHPISHWWIGITDRETEGVFKKESTKELSRNVANYFDKNKASNEKKDCLYLKRENGVKHAACSRKVGKKPKNFSPQPLCMKTETDTA